MKLKEQSPKYIVADAGYGSESNYRYLEDMLPEHTALIPYSTMLKKKKEMENRWDVETVFGRMKASLGFTRFMLREIDKVRKETGILIMALNIHKLAVRSIIE